MLAEVRYLRLTASPPPSLRYRQAKEAEVDSISDLLRTPVTHGRLARWLAENQGLLEEAGSAAATGERSAQETAQPDPDVDPEPERETSV